MPGTGRTRADDALIDALARGLTVQGAAAAAGLSIRTVYRRLEDSGFRARVDAVRSEMVSATIGALATLGDEATQALRGLIEGGQSETVKLGAARTALEFLFRGHEMHTLARQVEDLRRQVEGMKHGNGKPTSGGSENAGGNDGPGAGGEPGPGPATGGPGKDYGGRQPDTGPLADEPTTIPFTEGVAPLFETGR